jgi:hypothetical protein
MLRIMAAKGRFQAVFRPARDPERPWRLAHFFTSSGAFPRM